MAAPAVIANVHTSHRDAQWFPKAGLGIFLHWGLSSVEGAGDLSWSMMKDTPWDSHLQGRNKHTPAEYYALAERFNPTGYDPHRWLKAARRAGFRYAVLTCKHHDGYTLWPSAYGQLGTHTHLGGRDLVAPFVDACRDNDLKVGLYYSPPDWFFDRHHRAWGMNRVGEQRLAYNFDHELAPLCEASTEHMSSRVELARGQIRELLTRYGRVDLLWLDGGNDEMTPDEIRAMQPHLVINSRIGSTPGDFDHTECRMPEQRFAGWFETCNTWNSGSWGHTKSEVYGPIEDRLNELAVLRSWGGNLLTNLAPYSDGSLPAEAYRRLEELAAWMAHSGEAVHDVEPGLFPERCNVPMTRKGQRSYLFFRPHDPAEATIEGVAKPAAATLLRTGESVPTRRSSHGVTVELPQRLRCDTVEVVALDD